MPAMRVVLILAALFIIAGAAAAQQRRDPARLAKGTARIGGMVTAADTGLPVRRAAVRLMMSGRQYDVAVTDPDGRFEFLELPVGTYTVAASKAGFVTASFGETSYGSHPQEIELADAQRFNAAHIRLARGGVLTGRVFDEFGEPIPEAAVHASRVRYVEGMRSLDVVRTATSNDVGQFRLYGLAPGTYYLSGTVRTVGDAPMRDPGAMMQGIGGTPTFAQTFYPAGISADGARPIVVEPGQEISNLEFTLQPVRLLRLSGRVVDSRGRSAARARVMLQSAGRDAVMIGNMIIVLEKQTTDEGEFQLSGIVPGDYRIEVRPAKESNSLEEEYASVPVSLASGDVDGFVIATSRGHALSGRVIVEGGAFDADTFSPMTVNAFDIAGGGGVMGTRPPPGPDVASDGTFQIRGLIGTRVIRVDRIPEGWMLKAVRVQADDVTDRGVEIRGADVGDVEVVIARATEASGIVVDSKGQPAGDRAVVVFSVDSKRWSGFLNRYVMSARAGTDGTFAIGRIPPGEYFAVVVDPPADEWMAPENLDRLRSRATRFTLADGEQKTLRLAMR